MSNLFKLITQSLCFGIIIPTNIGCRSKINVCSRFVLGNKGDKTVAKLVFCKMGKKKKISEKNFYTLRDVATGSRDTLYIILLFVKYHRTRVDTIALRSENKTPAHAYTLVDEQLRTRIYNTRYMMVHYGYAIGMGFTWYTRVTVVTRVFGTHDGFNCLTDTGVCGCAGAVRVRLARDGPWGPRQPGPRGTCTDTT